MRLVGQLKKMTIDNKIDKEGDPDPRMALLFEFKFVDGHAAQLCAMIDGSQLVVEVSELQPDLFKGRGSPLDDPKSGVHGQTPGQPTGHQNDTLALPFAQAVEDGETTDVIDETTGLVDETMPDDGGGELVTEGRAEGDDGGEHSER